MSEQRAGGGVQMACHGNDGNVWLDMWQQGHEFRGPAGEGDEDDGVIWSHDAQIAVKGFDGV